MSDQQTPTPEQVAEAKRVLAAARESKAKTREVFVVRRAFYTDTDADKALGYKVLKYDFPTARKVLVVDGKRINLDDMMDRWPVQAQPFNHDPAPFSTMDKAREAIKAALAGRKESQALVIERESAMLDEKRKKHSDFCDALPGLLEAVDGLGAVEVRETKR